MRSRQVSKPYILWVWLFALALIQVRAGKGQTPSGQVAAPAAVPPALKIGPGDMLDVTVFDNPDLSGRFRVSEKGEITVLLLGAVHVQGLTAEEVGKTLEKLFASYEILQQSKDRVTVLISEYASQGITVTGEVKTPGIFPSLGVRMLHDTLTTAGGVLPSASTHILLFRREDPEHAQKVDYNPDGANPIIPRIQIFPGDSILIPRAGMVYVLGNVAKPGAYVLEGRNELTVEEVMALAGNTQHAADTKHARLVRRAEGNSKLDITFDLNKILRSKEADIALKDGDILYIPTSTGKLVTTQAINSALGIGTSVAVYRTAYQ